MSWIPAVAKPCCTLLAIAVAASCATPTPPTAAAPTTVTSTETSMPNHATGSFEVKMAPGAPDEKAEASIARLLLDKQFHGALEATSQGQMLAIRTDVAESAGYVALERVTGTLDGRSGSFALLHSGIMNRGVPTLTVTVVPDSGTGELKGLGGTMTIDIADGKHSYDFAYTRAESP
jgi:hypothetical protein